MNSQSKFRHTLSRLRSYFLFIPLILLYTAVLGIVSLISGIFERRGRFQHRLAQLWARLILLSCGVPVRVSGMDTVDTSKPHLYVVNHLSAMDIPALYAHLPLQFRILAKKELFRYPVFGWHLHLSGQLPIDSVSAFANMRSMKRAVKTLREGMPLVVFPEGGRSDDGQVKPFLRGAFYAAIKAQVEIIPMALVGAFEILPMNTFHIMPRPIELHIGQPISTARFTLHDMDKLASRAEHAVAEMYYARSHVADLRQSVEKVT